MNYNHEKIVEFHKYCNEGCKNWSVDDNVEGSVCDICLSNPVNLESERPVNYEPKED